MLQGMHLVGTPQKNKMRTEKQLFDDVYPMEHV